MKNTYRIFNSKAKTLKTLKPIIKKSKIEKTFVFELQDWVSKSDSILDQITKLFKGKKLVVRSSAANEDTLNSSLAGVYKSCLNISSSSAKEVRGAIESVLASYSEKGELRNTDEILIQTQTADVLTSGVVLTKDINNLAPYYLITFDDLSGSTQSVTSGSSNQTIEIYRGASKNFIPKKWRKLLSAVKELESIIPGTPLDIEFGIGLDGTVCETTDIGSMLRDEFAILRLFFRSDSGIDPHWIQLLDIADISSDFIGTESVTIQQLVESIELKKRQVIERYGRSGRLVESKLSRYGSRISELKRMQGLTGSQPIL